MLQSSRGYFDRMVLVVMCKEETRVIGTPGMSTSGEAARGWGNCGLWCGHLGEARVETTATVQAELMAAWIQVQVGEWGRLTLP